MGGRRGRGSTVTACQSVQSERDGECWLEWARGVDGVGVDGVGVDGVGVDGVVFC